MTDLVQAEKLHSFADHLQEDSFFEDDNGAKVNLRKVLTAPDAKIVNYDMLKYLQMKPGEKKLISTELHAIALTDYFLLLVQDKHTGKYRPFKVNEKVAARAMGPGHTFKFDDAKIFARAGKRVSSKQLESWFSGP
ncbi:unnamed protein product [Schistocephalus solidus]|uniref:Phage protein n=1 Tax=Schistocephalus solidus TaxID=70667 RepID=A0A183TBZ6_SCHSO|nr:unnamed protein product [Schistocephalus solidus]